jgi:preprotein translocase subunit SecA
MTALIARITQDVLDRLTGSVLASGRSAFEVIADDPELRREFVRKTFALPTASRPSLPLAGGNRQRNQPCPCGSGRKFKQCCGRGR